MSPLEGQRGAETLFGGVWAPSGRWRDGFDSFLFNFFASLSKGLARVGVRLILEVFISSTVLIINPEAKGKVQVRLKLECGLI